MGRYSLHYHPLLLMSQALYSIMNYIYELSLKYYQYIKYLKGIIKKLIGVITLYFLPLFFV